MSNLRPELPFIAVSPTAMPSDTHHHQLDVGQANEYQGTREKYYRGQIPFDPHYGAHLANDVSVCSSHSGGPHSSPPGHGVR